MGAIRQNDNAFKAKEDLGGAVGKPPLVRMKYRPDIDGLRAVAVISAVLFHVFPEWMGGGGFTGPEVFFVISGYLISSIIFLGLESGTFSFTDFYARRIRRVFPALLAVLIGCFVIGWFALLSDEFEELGRHIAGGAGFFSNFLLWREAGYFDTAAETKVLLHLWTLAIEEQFYLVWPLLLWLSWKARINLLLTTAVFAAISFFWNVGHVAAEPVATFYLPQGRFWEVLSGGLLAWFVVHRYRIFDTVAARLSATFGIDLRAFVQREERRRLFSNLGSVVGAGLLCFGLYGIKTTYSFPGYWAAIPVAATVILIMVGSEAWINRVLLSNRLMVGIGLISYPLYLWHWPLLSLSHIMLRGVPGVHVRWMLLAISVLLAWLTYRFVEAPCRSRRFASVKTVALSVSLLVVGLCGYGVYWKHGLEFRHANDLARSYKEVHGLTFYANPYMWKDKRCGKDLVASEKTICRITSDTPKVLVVGDSHAAQLAYDAVNSESHDVALVAADGCLPFSKYISVGAGQTFAEQQRACESLLPDALRVMAKFPSIDYVVFVVRGNVYVEGTGFGKREKKLKFELCLGSISACGHNYSRFVSGFVDAIDRFIAAGKRVVFVEDVPEIGQLARNCIADRPFAYLNRKLASCVISRQVYDRRSADYKRATDEIVHTVNGNIDLFPAYRYFCNEKTCSSIENGIPLYYDDDHLSLTGSRLVFGKLLQHLGLAP